MEDMYTREDDAAACRRLLKKLVEGFYKFIEYHGKPELAAVPFSYRTYFTAISNIRYHDADEFEDPEHTCFSCLNLSFSELDWSPKDRMLQKHKDSIEIVRQRLMLEPVKNSKKPLLDELGLNQRPPSDALDKLTDYEVGYEDGYKAATGYDFDDEEGY